MNWSFKTGHGMWKTSFLCLLLITGACSDDDPKEQDLPRGIAEPGTVNPADVDAQVLMGPDSLAEDALTPDTTANEVCDQNSPCSPGLFCIQTPNGNVCAADCADLCPETWSCVPEGGLLVCTPPEEEKTLCQPCYTHGDCGGDTEAYCVEYGPAGRFCGSFCHEDSPCPEGYGCTPQDNDGSIINVCILLNGTCECSAESIANQVSTPCYTIADGENCEGVRYCSDSGLTPCNVGIDEFCDGVDNDCDGLTDEDLLGCDSTADPNADEDGDGVTVGQGDCNDSSAQITPGKPDICDGINNDCDDEVDENGDGASCTVQNEFGVCAGMAICEDGEEVCQGPSANECGSCDPLPDLYGSPCGCGGSIGCDGTCEGDSPNPCVPTTCFVGTDSLQGSVGCPEVCSVCEETPWRLCFCSAGVGEASLSMSPSSLTVGEALTVAAWSPTALNTPLLLLNGLVCLGSPEPAPCENPDNCGGLVYTWDIQDTSLFQLGSNQLEVLTNTDGINCAANGASLFLKGFLPMTF